MAKTEDETADIRSASTSEPSLHSESMLATSVSVEAFSNDDEDIFDTSEVYERHVDGNHTSGAGEQMLSDLPAMQRQHMTAGYREGLFDSKAKSMQGGFDQGYPIGFQLGLRVGTIFGVLEGFLAAYAKDNTGSPTALVEAYGIAKKELAISQLLHGLNDEALARPEFDIEDLPLKSREALEKWEGLTSEMMTGVGMAVNLAKHRKVWQALSRRLCKEPAS